MLMLVYFIIVYPRIKYPSIYIARTKIEWLIIRSKFIYVHVHVHAFTYVKLILYLIGVLVKRV